MLSARANNPKQPGTPASDRAFSADYRYSLQAINTRFDSVEWFVKDVQRMDESIDLPEVVYQGTYADCVKYLQSVNADTPFRCVGDYVTL